MKTIRESEVKAVNLQCSLNAVHNRRFMKKIYNSTQDYLESEQHITCVLCILALSNYMLMWGWSQYVCNINEVPPSELFGVVLSML